MICRNRIWEELKQAKANIICIQKYTDKRRAYNRWYNFLIALTASVGALGSIFNVNIPLFTSIGIAFASIAKSVFPHFLQNETELSSLDLLADFYNKYMNSLENIWYKFYHNIISEENAMKEFFELKETECEKQSQLNRLVRNISKNLQRKIDEDSTLYINSVYFEKDTEKQ
ncbi:hypothetical protein [uncultured Bacteroides sp.]|uniref:hypothetical protein n=1 Tax=uncultured Bacteroides sp. TaxID=162156 RepID=UPI0025F702CE|nr:hypothetical protein [uncultured Bacteroides sp.]